MLMVISPAKKLEVEGPSATQQKSQAALLNDAQILIDELKQLAPQDISSLMSISDKLGLLNYDRYQAWQLPFSLDNAKQAILAFKGDVYVGLEAESFSVDDYTFAQQHLRILSGLYGVLRPLDLMQAYRLEMGTRFENSRGKNLYEFWGEKITGELNRQLKKNKSDILINLASTEYFKSVKPASLHADIVTPLFKDKKSGQYKTISFYAKKARGLMAAYAIRNKITDARKLKKFDVQGYSYNAEMSKENEWVFTREEI
ncbi:hypothetical protein AB835_05780 [Candidatus Endobugula sertula]|uniref:UPF0246 protein AB835_05780 n=1 Tax=Candidatus Endobugula sertula TaxID=62101 RepID=A0A1D2QR70_9GAMM|nr:hypothetical protein AB835_05780 [Candidatus Endobugula sertula]